MLKSGIGWIRVSLALSLALSTFIPPVAAQACSDSLACTSAIPQSLQVLREIVMLNGAQSLTMCMDRLEQHSLANSLLMNACRNLVLRAVSDLERAEWDGLGQHQWADRHMSSGQTQASSTMADSATLNVDQTIHEFCQQNLHGIRNQLDSAMSNCSVRLARQLINSTQRTLPTGVAANTASDVPSNHSEALPQLLLSNLSAIASFVRSAAFRQQGATLQLLLNTLPSIASVLNQYALPNSHQFSSATTFLICSSLFPTCMCGGDSSGSDNVSSSASGSDVGVLKACSWQCRTPQTLASLAAHFSTGSISSTESQNMISFLELISQCEPLDADQCLDSNCVHISQSGQYVCELNSLQYNVARASSQQLCIPQQDAFCPYPLQNTSQPQHFAAEVRDTSASFRQLAVSLFRDINITTSDSKVLFPCGKTCTGILYNLKKEGYLRSVAVAVGVLTLAVQLFAVASFVINRKKVNRFPTRFFIYIHICAIVGCLGILGPHMQSKGWRHTACNGDGTLRQNLPTSEESGSGACTFSAAVLMFAFASTLEWWICLAHAWHKSFAALRSVQDKFLDSKRTKQLEITYHIVAWSYSVGITIVFLLVGKPSGLPMFGSCYSVDEGTWFFFVTIPTLIWGTLSSPFLVKGLLELRRTHAKVHKVQKHQRRKGLVHEQLKHLRRFQVKLGFIIIISFVHLLVLTFVGILRHIQAPTFERSMEHHITCNLLTCKEQRDLCPASPQQSFAGFTFVTVITYAELMVICAWTVTRDNFHAWREFFRSPVAVLKNGAPLRTRKSQKPQPVPPKNRPSSTSSNDSTPTTNTGQGSSTSDLRLCISPSSSTQNLVMVSPGTGSNHAGTNYLPRLATGDFRPQLSVSSIDSTTSDTSQTGQEWTEMRRSRLRNKHGESVSTLLTCISESTDDLAAAQATDASEDAFASTDHDDQSKC